MPSSISPVASRLRLWLCISLPIAIGWWLPRSYGASIEAFPLMIGLLIAGLAASIGLGGVRRSASLWLLAIALVVLLRGSPIPLYTLMIVPVVVAAWIGFALGSAAARDERFARAIGWGLVLGIGINFVSALLQFFSIEAHFYPWFSLNGSERIYGNLRQANHLATLFVASLALLWWAAARRALVDWQIALLVAFACFGIAVTGSRTGWIEVMVLAALAWWWRKSVTVRAAACFMLAPLLILLFSLGTAAWGPQHANERVTVAERPALQTTSLRLLHWTAAADLIRAEPLLGVGWKEFRTARFMVRPEDSAIEVVENAHNSVLHLAVELGVPAALLMTVPVLVFIVRRRPWREADPRAQAVWLLLAALLLHSMVEHPLWYLNFLFLAAMAAGFLLAVHDEPSEPLWNVPRPVGWVLIAATLAAMVDYDRASAPYGSTLFNWGDTSERRMNAAQQSFLFGIYADRALLPRVRITEENQAAVASLADRLMNFTPDPQVLDARLLAYCAGGDMATVEETARNYRLAYPIQFAEFRERLTPAMRERCRV